MKKLGPFISALLLLTISVSYAWALPNCLGSYSEITWDNCIGTYIWKNKNKYVGGFKDGKKMGTEFTPSPMEINTQVSTRMAIGTVKAHFLGQMGINT